MVLLSIFFTRIDPRRDHQQIGSLFILSLHALALHLAVKILLHLLHEDLRTLALHTSVGCISLQNASRGPHFVTQTNTIKWKHSLFDINHQQNTRRSDQIETIKTIMQTTRPRGITWKVLPMAQVAIFKEIFDQVRKDLDCELFYSELKRHNVSHYI